MSVSFRKRGDFSHLNKHNLLDNLELPDQHPISSIINLQPIIKCFGESIGDIYNKIKIGDIGDGYGIVSRPRYKKNIMYKNDKMFCEEYSGDINKTVYYEYNGDLLVRKVVKRSDGATFTASYEYDEGGRLISINDSGTDEEYVHCAGGIASYYTVCDTVSSTDKYLVCDVSEVFDTENMATIVDMEIYIKNTGVSNAQLIISKNNNTILSTSIDSSEVQKYNLGISKHIQIYVVGAIEFEFNISYIKQTTLSSGGLHPDVYKCITSLASHLSDIELRYDTILNSVNNTHNSFTDLLKDDTNLEDIVNYQI